MKVLVIVGTSHLDANNESTAKQHIKQIICDEKPDLVASGEAAGIDKLVHQVCNDIGQKFAPFPPKHDHWECIDNSGVHCYGFKARNLDMADIGTIGYAIVNRNSWLQMGDSKWCYHCKCGGHERSGACYTLKAMQDRGKYAKWILLY